MDTDLSVQMLAINSARTQGLVQIAVMRKRQEMDRSLIAMIDEVTRAAPTPPPGTGTRVDKTA